MSNYSVYYSDEAHNDLRNIFMYIAFGARDLDKFFEEEMT